MEVPPDRIGPRRPRQTIPGHIPTAWKRPRRASVVWLALTALAYDAFLILAAPPEGTLDARLFYGPADIATLFEALGEHGRASYAFSEAADLGFILVYTALWLTWLRFLRVRGALPRGVRPVLALLPGLFDAAETGSILGLLASYPEVGGPLATAATVATPLKWIAIAAILVLVIWGEIRLRRHRHH